MIYGDRGYFVEPVSADLAAAPLKAGANGDRVDHGLAHRMRLAAIDDLKAKRLIRVNVRLSLMLLQQFQWQSATVVACHSGQLRQADQMEEQAVKALYDDGQITEQAWSHYRRFLKYSRFNC